MMAVQPMVLGSVLLVNKPLIISPWAGEAHTRPGEFSLWPFFAKPEWGDLNPLLNNSFFPGLLHREESGNCQSRDPISLGTEVCARSQVRANERPEIYSRQL